MATDFNPLIGAVAANLKPTATGQVTVPTATISDARTVKPDLAAAATPFSQIASGIAALFMAWVAYQGLKKSTFPPPTKRRRKRGR